jgi:hypothetical protein
MNLKQILGGRESDEKIGLTNEEIRNGILFLGIRRLFLCFYSYDIQIRIRS